MKAPECTDNIILSISSFSEANELTFDHVPSDVKF